MKTMNDVLYIVGWWLLWFVVMMCYFLVPGTTKILNEVLPKNDIVRNFLPAVNRTVRKG